MMHGEMAKAHSHKRAFIVIKKYRKKFCAVVAFAHFSAALDALHALNARGVAYQRLRPFNHREIIRARHHGVRK